MDSLDNLYSNSNMKCDNPICEGCSILSKDKPLYSHMDYENLDQCDVLFLSDSLKVKFGTVKAFWPKEIELIEAVCKVKYTTAASVKCASVVEKDMKTADQHKCRNHLEDTIRKVKPKLVFVCGNLALKMLTKKSGISNKRGSAIDYELDDIQCKVVPIFHPFAVIKEPKNLPLFQSDIRNALDLFIYGDFEKKPIEYKLLMDIKDVEKLAEELNDYEGDLGVDTETTGLDFKRDRIMTVGISSENNNWVIPLDHKDSPWSDKEKKQVIKYLKSILENPKSSKIFHNAKFDLKQFYNYGINVVNVWDTKVMYHNLDEYSPKGLMDLVKRFFPEELAQM